MDRLRSYRTAFLDQWFSLDSKAYFVIICGLYFTSLLLKRVFIVDDIAAFEILSERGEMWVFDLFFGLQYFVVPIFLAWKFTLTAFVIWVGCFLFGYKVFYSQLWKLVMIFELIFIIPEMLKIIWFTALDTDPLYQEIIAFYPLSMLSLIDYESIHIRWHYPLKALNIFEIGYWLLLTVGIFWLSNKKIKTSALIVLTSYIFPFLIWLFFYAIVYR